MDNDHSNNQYQSPPNQQMVTPYIDPFNNINADLIKLALTSNDILEEIRMRLLGLEWDDKNQVYVQETEPLMQKPGVNKIITQIASFLNRNTSMTDLPEEEITNLARQFEHNLRRDFFDNWKRYWENEWQAESNWPIVRSMAGNYAYLALRRSKEGREREILGGNTKTLISRSQVDNVNGSMNSGGGQPLSAGMMGKLSKVFR